MNDLVRDWRRWTLAERIIAVAVAVLLVLVLLPLAFELALG